MSRAENPANTYYVHPAGEGGPSILLNLDLVESLAQWAGYAASQGHEIHGVLFGNADVDPRGPVVLAIEDCEPLKDEIPPHGGGLRPIGMVRSDLSGTLLPDDEDRDGLRQLIPDPNRVLLLVKPGPEPMARILPDAGGGTAPFPLERAKLAQDARQTLRVPWVRAATGKALVLVALVGAVAVGALFWPREHRKVAVTSANDGPVALSVRSDGPNYLVRWDRSSPVVRTARSGVLHVTDDGIEQAIPLTAEDLLAGGKAYVGRGSSAAFRLELPTPPPARATEAAQSREGEAPTAFEGKSAARSGRSVRGKSPDSDPYSAEVAESAGLPQPSAAAPTASSSEADQRVADPGESKRSDGPPPEAEADRTAKPAAHATLPKHPGFVTSVNYRPAPDNPIRRGLQKVPGLRILQHWRFKGGDNFEPARPVHEVKPSVSARVAPGMPASARVVLEVYLDPKGKVSGVEIASPGVNDHLIGAATTAVYGSSFKGAKLNGKPVESRLIAEFDFRKSS